jgi:hypothetical protein
VAEGTFNRIGTRLDGFGETAVRRGIPPSWFGYRWVKSESVQDYFERRTNVAIRGSYRTIHTECVIENALPRNVQDRSTLPNDRGWWGYSFYDVPARASGETFIATLPNCTVVPYVDVAKRDFWVGIINENQRVLRLREFHFRDGHARSMRTARNVDTVPRATWLIERVFHNYSHWLTAHLPKFVLLKAMNLLDGVMLPRSRPAFVDASLRMIGLDPHAFATFDESHPLRVQELTVLGTDRFRPELLASVRDACPLLTQNPPHRRVFISRTKADRRVLVNENEIWSMLADAGFERVHMEDLEFDAQVALMQETAILFAPHGAGLTNMMFCAHGTQVVEIADLSFPNPNFYATAAAMGHEYWLLAAEPIGDRTPLERDMRISPAAVAELLPMLN